MTKKEADERFRQSKKRKAWKCRKFWVSLAWIIGVVWLSLIIVWIVLATQKGCS